MTELETVDQSLAPEGHDGPWTPETIRDVEWVLAQIGQAEADIAEIQAQFEAASKALSDRARSITEKPMRRSLWFRSLVEQWAVTHRDEVVRGKSKTRELLSGSVAFRAVGEKIEVLDPEALMAWAQESHLELLDMKPRIDKKALDRFVKSTGEIPPGCDVTAPTETVHVKPHPLPTITAKDPKVLP